MRFRILWICFLSIVFSGVSSGQGYGIGISHSSIGHSGVEAIFRHDRSYAGLKYTFRFENPAIGQEITTIEGMNLQRTGSAIRQTSFDILFGYYLISDNVALEGELSFAMRNDITNYSDPVTDEDFYQEGLQYTQVELGCHVFFNVYRGLHLGIGFNTGRNNEIGVRYFF